MFQAIHSYYGLHPEEDRNPRKFTKIVGKKRRLEHHLGNGIVATEVDVFRSMTARCGKRILQLAGQKPAPAKPVLPCYVPDAEEQKRDAELTKTSETDALRECIRKERKQLWLHIREQNELHCEDKADDLLEELAMTYGE